MKKQNLFNKIFSTKNPARIILTIYLIIIFIGTILLTLPISTAYRTWTAPIDAFFTTVSAVCVTGLTTVTTAVHWNLFGKIILISLIQLGGLGVMTAASILALVFNKKMTVSNRLQLSEENNMISLKGLMRLIKFIIISTFIIEGIGALLLMTSFIPKYGVLKGIGMSFFHAISAFCNAGFDIIGETSISPFALDVSFTIVISALIIIGGIGHKVISELLEKKLNYKKYSLHTKIVLLATGAIILVPTILFLIFEWNNPETLGNHNVFNKILLAFFESVTLRTAGFFTVNQGSLMNSSILLTLPLMFVGGSPAGTAGGFKTTTAASLYLITKSNLRKEKDITIFNRRLPEEVTKKTVALFTISVMWMFLAILFLAITNPEVEILDILFEVFSAYGTVGLTRGITSGLSILGKIIISLTMIFGKIGPISLVLAFIKVDKPKIYREREEAIIIG